MFDDRSDSHTCVMCMRVHDIVSLPSTTQVSLGKLSRLDWRTDWFCKRQLVFNGSILGNMNESVFNNKRDYIGQL